MPTDKTLSCRDCGSTFTFTASEQEFFAEKGFTNEPTRCPSCRAARKAERQDGYSSGGGGGYRSGSREMFPVVCAQCGKDTQVPFKPTGDRPVYCTDCFGRRPSTSSSSRNRY